MESEGGLWDTVLGCQPCKTTSWASLVTTLSRWMRSPVRRTQWEMHCFLPLLDENCAKYKWSNPRVYASHTWGLSLNRGVDLAYLGFQSKLDSTGTVFRVGHRGEYLESQPLRKQRQGDCLSSGIWINLGNIPRACLNKKKRSEQTGMAKLQSINGRALV